MPFFLFFLQPNKRHPELDAYYAFCALSPLHVKDRIACDIVLLFDIFSIFFYIFMVYVIVKAGGAPPPPIAAVCAFTRQLRL